MDGAHQQEYNIRDLGTQSVTLFPSRAQVVRQIKGVPLKAGANQITIIGLSPTVDEHSIKVEGAGSAIITDIAIENRPNRDIFQDIYPDSDDDSGSEDESDREEDDVTENVALEAVRGKITVLLDEEKRAKEVIASAESRLTILDSYGKLLTTDRKHQADVNINDGIETYRLEREKVFQDHMDGTVKDRDIHKQLVSLKKEERRLQRLADKEGAKVQKIKAKALRAKQRETEKEARKRSELLKEKARIRRERESFWPKTVHVIKVSLDATNFTPTSSRRNSISSDIVKVASEASDQDGDNGSPATCDLTVSYVTTYAFWSPSYDLALSTTTNSGSLCFDARLTNMTSETWSNCKIILSTSQADFSGLNDVIPTLVPWRVRLAGKGGFGTQSDIMYSREESTQRAGWSSQQGARSSQKPRWDMFGLDSTGVVGVRAPAPPPAPAPVPAPMLPAPARPFSLAQHPPQSSIQAKPLFAPASGGLFGSAAASNAPAGAPGAASAFGGAGTAFGGAVPPAPMIEQVDHLSHVDERRREVALDLFGDGATLAEPQPELTFQESSFEETGFTSTYDLPGLKTLSPSSTVSKQRVARVSFSSVTFSHSVVAKYKPAAYLKAKLRNGSSITLLKGATGLTLDGSFMGRTTLPRCSPGDSFSLSLGVDPAIRVAYPKPDVKRSQSGLFNKEDSGIYTRTITLLNTRSGSKGKPVQLTVLDQIPVSEDERLRIDILQPRGMVLGGAAVAAGVSGRDGKEEKDWGKAAASLKKGGEVSWNVTLNAGRMVKLGLEYECAYPTGDHVVNV